MLQINQTLKKQGSALLSALFIMTLVAIAATAMSTRLQLDIYRTSIALTSDKLYLASQAVTFWAMNTLTMNNNEFIVGGENGKVANLPRYYQQNYPDVVINGALYDLQSRFNINNLRDKRFQLLFYKLMENAHVKLNAKQQKILLNAIYNRINIYQPGRGHDQAIEYYLSRKPPYLPGYQPMQSISELRLVQGVNAELYQKLLPYITVLPEVTPVNLNTASKTVLMSLGNGLTEANIEELIETRGQEGIKSMDKLTLLLQKFDIPKDQITIESNYYLSVATTSSADIYLTTFTIIKRSKDNMGNISVGIVQESLNTL